jgi:acyl-CoA dehydrogenase
MEISELTQRERAFRDEVRAFYAENLTPEFRRAARLAASMSEFEYGRRWQKILHAKGWGAPNWPVKYGGCDWTPTERFIFDYETALANPPGIMMMGRELCAPCIMEFGTDEQKAAFLPKIIAGEDWWAQGYSEPNCGSDLASLQLRADSDGDHYVLNGSKIWTTFAHHANRIFVLVRTATMPRKQSGITFLLADMDTPGIQVRPIINLAGDHEFNQVFFTDARVPKSRRLGGEHDGWNVARHLLRFEHGSLARGGVALRRQLGLLLEIANFEGDGGGGRLADDPDFSRHLAEIGLRVEATEAALLQAFALLREGAPPPPTLPLLGIRSRELASRIYELMLEAAAYYGAVFQPAARKVASSVEPIGPETSLIAAPYYLGRRGGLIAGGTPDIQRNNLARALLGLR